MSQNSFYYLKNLTKKPSPGCPKLETLDPESKWFSANPRLSENDNEYKRVVMALDRSPEQGTLWK